MDLYDLSNQLYDLSNCSFVNACSVKHCCRPQCSHLNIVKPVNSGECEGVCSPESV